MVLVAADTEFVKGDDHIEVIRDDVMKHNLGNQLFPPPCLGIVRQLRVTETTTS